LEKRDIGDLWNQVLSKLENKISKPSFDTGKKFKTQVMTSTYYRKAKSVGRPHRFLVYFREKS